MFSLNKVIISTHILLLHISICNFVVCSCKIAISGVEQTPSGSILHAMHPIIEALIAKELVKHPDMNVNISVATCLCEVMRIMAPENPYNDDQMKV